MAVHLNFKNEIVSEKVAIGIVCAKNLYTSSIIPAFDLALEALLMQRKNALNPSENAIREASRNMLRNGTYKPTGRGKPASEYLLRAAENDTFPRINAPVDINNFMSLKYLLPISLWDVDLAQSHDFNFRLGNTGEQYIFNTGGQEIGVQDLVVGCRIQEGVSTPIVNPIKDSLATKTTAHSSFIAAAIYTPIEGGVSNALTDICAEFAHWLAQCGSEVKTNTAILLPQEVASLAI
jgi:DNA/RNA-binding domain of Phe-tRNA-synthetase-like protein